MKTYFSILSIVILSLFSCKKGAIPKIPETPDTHVLLKPLEDNKITEYKRLKIKPFCYKDFNTAYLNSKKEGC